MTDNIEKLASACLSGYADGRMLGYEASLRYFTTEEEKLMYKRGYDRGVFDYCETLDENHD